MKNIKLLLLSSIFIAYGTQHAMSGGAVAPTPPAKRTFDKAELQEEIDPNEGTSEAAQKLEDAKRRRAELTAEIAERQKELTIATKEEQEASRNAGTEGADRLKRKIEQHLINIKATEEDIKQATANQELEIKRLKEERKAQLDELTASHAAVLKELNDKKALSLAKKAAREQELAALKGAKAGAPAPVPATAPAATKGTAAKKVNAVVESTAGLGGLFGGLQAIQAQVNQVSDTAAKISETATGTIQNAASQVDGIKGQVSDAQASVASAAGLKPSHSIKTQSNGHSAKTISI